MNRFIKTIIKIVSISLIIVLIITNPGSDRYELYASQKIVTYLKSDFCAQAAKPLKSSCYVLIDTAQPQIKITISNNTKKQNFFLFSIYNTELPLSLITSTYEFRTLGIVEKFFTYQTDKNE